MCTGKCSKCIGITLFPLAVCAIVSNILLYFPNGQVLQLTEITDMVWFFHGILGAGILVILPAFMMLGAGGAGCCANRCGMLLSVILSVLGFAGGAYCVVISSLGLIGGPLCDTGDGEYLYPFRNDTLEDNYLFNQTTWSICKQPENIILWNIVLFSILLAIGVIEAILCFIQVINGLTGFICGTCMRRRKNGALTDLKEDEQRMYRAFFETLQGQLKNTVFSLLLPPWSQIHLHHLVVCLSEPSALPNRFFRSMRSVAALEEHLGQHRQ